MPQKQHTIHGRDHLPTGADPIPGFPSTTGDDLEDLILATSPDAFWKLNETSGLVAYDSSGNDHDLTATTFGPPDWGAAAGPPGDTTAHFNTLTDDTRLSSSVGDPMSDFIDNFTAGIWISVGTSGGAQEILGQGTPYHGGTGWGLHIVTDTFSVLVDGIPMDANDPFDLDTWYFLAVVRDSGTWKLYVNGLLQANTDTTDPSTGYGAANTWIGNDAHASHGSYLKDSLLSYGFITNTVLTSTELLAMYETGTSGGALAQGLVWTTNGAGGASWEAPTIEVDY